MLDKRLHRCRLDTRRAAFLGKFEFDAVAFASVACRRLQNAETDLDAIVRCQASGNERRQQKVGSAELPDDF